MPKKLTKQQKGARSTKAKADANAKRLYPHVRKAWLDSGGNRAHIADILNAKGVPAPGGGRWYTASASRTIRRIEQLSGRPLPAVTPLDRQDSGEYHVPRYSVDGRRLRSYARLSADKKARHKKKLRAWREYRQQHGAQLKTRLIELYEKHFNGPRYSAGAVAADLRTECFPVPGGERWSAEAVLREGRKVGAPWRRKFTSAQWAAHQSAKHETEAFAEAEELERRGRHAEAARVLAKYFSREEEYEREAAKKGGAHFKRPDRSPRT